MSAATDQALKNYGDLLAKIDASFASIQSKAGRNAMQCSAGCHQCCLPGLSVNAVEAAHLARFIAAHPSVQERLSDLASRNPHHGQRCQLLDEQGRCAVYPARPIVCRSHGAPIAVPEAGGRKVDVCPLNFKGFDLEQLPSGMVLNLELLNTLLALIDAQYRDAQAKVATAPATEQTGGSDQVPLPVSQQSQSSQRVVASSPQDAEGSAHTHIPARTPLTLAALSNLPL